jgi:hypothetical protein
LPLSGEWTKNTECLQRFTDLITYNETGTLPTSLDPIITARDQTTATI